MLTGFRVVLLPLVLSVLASCGGGGGNPVATEAGTRAVPLAQAALPDNGTAMLRVYQAFYGGAPASSDYFSMTAQAGDGGGTLAARFAAEYAAWSDDGVAQAVLTNLGVTSASVNANSYNILRSAVAQFFAAHGSNATTRGQIVVNLANLLAGLEADVTYGAAARGFNASIATNRTYASNGANSVASTCAGTVTTGYPASLETGSANEGGGCGMGSIAAAPVDAGSGGDGGGAGGGGAAAGGGLGKVLGATLQVMDLSNGAVVGEAITDATNGLVTVKTFNRPGPFLLTMRGRAGARYYDEGRNAMVDFPVGTTLHALVDRWDEHVGVSPLTEAAYRYALNNYKRTAADVRAGRTPLVADGDLRGLTAAQVRSANDLVRDAVNVRYVESFGMTSAKSLPTPIDGTSSSATLRNSKYGISAIVNGGLVKSSARFNPALAAPALAFNEEFARDLTDGRIDGFALDGTPAATARTYPASRLPDWSQASAEQLAAAVGTALAPSNKSIIDVVYRMEYYVTAPIFADASISDAANIIVDNALLLSDGSITLFRTRNGTTTRTDNFATNVKRLFHFASPNLKNTNLPITAATDRIAQQAYMLKNDGTVWAWGSSVYCVTSFFLDGASPAEQAARTNASYRRLPGSSGDLMLSPIQIPGLANITDMAVGKYNENWIARDANGDVFVWGRDNFNGTVYRQTPGTGTGLLQTRDHTRLITGSVVTTMSLADADFYRNTPGCIAPARQVTPLPKADSVAAGVNAQYVLTTDGRVFGWGSGVEAGFNFVDASSFNTNRAAFELNVQSTPRNLNIPGVVRQLNSVKIAGSGPDVILAATLTDDVYVWGGVTNTPRTYASVYNRSPPIYRDAAADVGVLSTVFLRDTGLIEMANASGGTTFFFVPSLVRVLKPVGDRTWLFAKDGRIYEVANGGPQDITAAVRNGTR